MGIFSFITTAIGASDEMARTIATLKSRQSALASSYVDRLRSARIDAANFEVVFAELSACRELMASDVIEIANSYSAAGLRATSKKAALAKIKKRFVELVRQAGKNKAAEKARPW